MQGASAKPGGAGSQLELLPAHLQELVVAQLDVAGKYCFRETCSRFRVLTNASVTTLYVRLHLAMLNSAAPLHWGRRFPNVRKLVLVADHYRSTPCPKLLAILAAELPAMQSLRSLDLQCCTPVSRDLVATLKASAPALEQLVLPPTKLANASEVLETVAQLPSLSSLQLCRAGVRRITFNAILGRWVVSAFTADIPNPRNIRLRFSWRLAPRYPFGRLSRTCKGC